ILGVGLSAGYPRAAGASARRNQSRPESGALSCVCPRSETTRKRAGRYRQGVYGVSNRSKVFRIALRFAALACGQNFEVESLYSTWKTALFAGAKYVE